ncbi:CD1107 family mobile element protein [Criibacterium bergeronii]|nr:DUF4366 domain-containing protein [Criibacterium bergeronii]
MKKSRSKLLLGVLMIFTVTFFSTHNIFAEDTYNSTKVRNAPTMATNSRNVKEEQKKDPYKASENTARVSTPVQGNVSERSNSTTPTKQAYTTGTITENVGEDAKPFESDIAPKRQFLTFTTNDGKEFHLIIDYLKDNQQVRMLTEVNESDLLNIIDKRSRKEDGSIESQEEIESRIRREVQAEYSAREKQAQQEQEKQEKTKKRTGSSDIIFYIFIGVIAVAVIFGRKFLKKKQQANSTIDDQQEFAEEDEDEIYNQEDDELNFEEDDEKNK